MRAVSLFLVALCVNASLVRDGVAQGTADDYRRAAEISDRFFGKVRNERLTPSWSEDGDSFGYRRERPGGGYEFVIVDAATGRSVPAFDHDFVADQLTELTGEETSPEALPLDQLIIESAEAPLLLAGDGDCWVLDRDSEELTPLRGASPSLATTVIRHTGRRALRRRSRLGGDGVSVLFVNATEAPVTLFWITPTGDRSEYSTIAPGKTHQQPTYAGHVWHACAKGGEPLAAFEATESGGVAVVETPTRDETDRRGESFNASPDGVWEAFFRDHNLWVKRIDGGEEVALSESGDEADYYGGRVWWSPDSKRVVALQTIPGGDRVVHYVESSPEGRLQPMLRHYDYLKPGDDVAQSRPRLFDVEAGKRIATNDELIPNMWSVSRVEWRPDSSGFSYLYNERGHQLLRVVSVDGSTGESRVVVEERSDTFICYSRKSFLKRLPETGELIWMSERDGWNHLYLYDTTTGDVKNQITRGEWVVRGVESVDEERREIVLRCSGVIPGQDPYYVHYARVGFDGSGFTLLTAANGSHRIRYSPDGRYFVDTWSRVDSPPVHELRRASDGELITVVERADNSELISAGWIAPERFVAKGRDGETDIHGVIYRPTGFDPHRSYPVIECIYAGPHDSHVPKSFSAHYRAVQLVELGFIVVRVDGMGTSNRSKAFHDVCWKNLGDAGFPDRIAWIRAAAAANPEMDLERVGIYGTSAGGQNSLRALLAHPDFYRVGVSDCGCHDNRMDKIWWNEQWMGWPVGPHYDEQSNVTQAHRLEGQLLLMVGEVDENVDPASTMQVVDALVDADRDFDLLVMPGVGHGVLGTEYGRRRMHDFFVRHLLGVEPRAASQTLAK